MKKFNKFISLVLSLLMIFAVCIPVFASSSSTSSDLPIIYLPGSTATLYDETTGEKVFPVVDDTAAYVKEVAPDVAKALAKALAKETVVGDSAWDEYCDVLYEKVAYLFTPLALDENGNPKDNIGVNWDAKTSYVSTKKSNYTLFNYTFWYDWRLDPVDSAKDLDIYIGRVLAATGKSKIKIFAHCLGATVLDAYIANPNGEFEHTDAIESVVLSVPSDGGSMNIGAIFSGQLSLDPDAINNYCTYYLSSDESDFAAENPELAAFAIATVSLLNEMKVLGLGTDAIERIYDKVKDNIVPRLVHSSYFVPSYFAMIGDEYFEDAVNFLFNDEYKQQYSGFLDKINFYHDNVQVNIKTNLAKLQDSGVKVSNIVRYGFNILPICEGSQTLGDGKLEVSSLSYGATTSDMDNRLSDSYIAAAEADGTIKYISADRKIDASTCLFPDNTWFIRNYRHFGTTHIETMAMMLLNSESQPTVWDYEEYPQFMHYDEQSDSLVQVTSDDYELDSKWTTNFMQSILRFFKTIFNLFTMLFKK